MSKIACGRKWWLIKMKKTSKLILVALSALLLTLLCACDVKVDIGSTKLTVDPASFSGSRVMNFTINEKTDITNETTKILEKYCPAELAMKVDSHKDSCGYTFTLSFSNKSDYESKVTSLTGKTAVVTFTPPTSELYSDGCTLTENFTTQDLFKWVDDAVAKEQASGNDKLKDVNLKYITDNASAKVVIDDTEQTSGEKIKINVQPISYRPSRIVINTIRYGENDYQRTISFAVDAKIAEQYGTLLEKKVFTPLVLDKLPSGMLKANGWNSDKTAYNIELVQCDFKNLQSAMTAVFPGSKITYENDKSNPFKESGILTENIFAGDFQCNKDKTSNFVMKYSTSDSSEAANPEQTFNKVTSFEIKTPFESKYKISGIDTALDISFSGRAKASIILNYADAESSYSGAKLAEEYFNTNYGSKGIKCSVETVGSTASTDTASDYAAAGSTAGSSTLVLSASGSDEDITKAMTALLGENSGYSLKITKKTGFSIFNKYNVEHNVNLSEFVKMIDGFEGKYSYTFNGSAATVKNVAYSTGDKTKNDLLGGKENFKTFTEKTLTSPQFNFHYQYNTVDLITSLVLAVAAVGLLILLSLISKTIAKRKSEKNLAYKEEVSKQAIMSVALAVIPEAQRGALSELPPELSRRPSVVLEPKIDDGLDEDDDMPENVWLFTTAMKLLSLLAAILFFFPLASTSTSVYISLFAKKDAISAFNLMIGTDLFGVHIDANAMMSVLLIIPLVIIALLSFKDVIPKFLASLGTLALSIFEIFYMSSISDTIEKVFETVKEQADSKYGHITTPILDVGYNYTIVVFVLLTLGAVVMIGFDIAQAMRERRSLKSDS